MRAAFVLGLTALTLWLASRFMFGISLEAAAGATGRWVERARRAPAVLPGTLDHRSLALAGGSIARHAARALVVGRVELGEGPVVAIAEKDNVLALGLFDGGAFKVEAGGEPEAIDIDERVNDLAFAPDGTLYAATAGGAFKVAPEGEPKKIASGVFQAVAIWKGRAHFASPRGLSIADDSGFVTLGRDQGFGADSPAALADCGPRLCAGALDGLWTWDGSKATRLGSDSGALPSDWVTAVGYGSFGLWAGTFDAGLARLYPQAHRVAPADGLPEGRVQPHALVVGEDAMFAGTPAGLLELREGSAALVAEGLPSKEITALAPAGEGGLWVGLEKGAVRVLVMDAEVAP
jgi:ligand-binding sensor domain-containing protein